MSCVSGLLLLEAHEPSFSGSLQVFSPVDRSHLLDDAFNLARAGLLDYPTALSMTSYLATEAHFYPWHSVKGGLDYISAMLYGHPDYYLLRVCSFRPLLCRAATFSNFAVSNRRALTTKKKTNKTSPSPCKRSFQCTDICPRAHSGCPSLHDVDVLFPSFSCSFAQLFPRITTGP